MKNLKLLRASQKVTVAGDNFCIDLDENVYFSCNKGIQSLRKLSGGMTFCSKLESDDQEDKHHVIGMEFLVESNSVFIASSSGNLYLYNLAEEKVNNIGDVDSGIEEFGWSPDQEFLVLLTGQRTLVLMTNEFDPITEKDLSAVEFGESKPINVGWGSKTTQFHGSEGKEAALVKQKAPVSSLSYDDHRSRISWRNDGEYFVISSIDEARGYRLLRIWSKDAVLQSTSEMLEGIEESLSWRPIGDLIACSQQCPNKHKIIFVEKNGLKHGEFSLPFKPNTFRVITLSWSNDSSVLAVAARELTEDSSNFQVMLWTTGNYHWYLKQQFTFQNSSPHRSLIMKWSSDNPLEMYCYNQSNGQLINLQWSYTTFHSPPQYNWDDSLVLSIDNENILASPLGKLVVPPPLCGYKFTLTSSVQSVFFAPDKPAFGAYLGDYKLAIFIKGDSTAQSIMTEGSSDCKFQLVAAGGNGFKSQVQPYLFHSLHCIKVVLEVNNQPSFNTWPYCLSHWTWVKDNSLLCVCYTENEDGNLLYSILHMKMDIDVSAESRDIIARRIVDLDKSVIAMCSNEKGSIVAVQYEDGQVIYFDIDEILHNSAEHKTDSLHYWRRLLGDELTFRPPCPEMEIVNQSAPNCKEFIVGLSPTGTFDVDGIPEMQFVTSYFVQGGFLFRTTTNHTLHVYQFDANKQNGKFFNKTEQKIERNAKIVFVPPNSTKVILQMPRGNLETIHPRPLVLAAIFKHLDKLEFGKAFELVKVHRIDLNVLYDYNPKKFLENTKLFTEQLSSKDLNLFLANLKPVNVCEDTYNIRYNLQGDDARRDMKISTYFDDKVNVLCDKIREILDPNIKEHFLPFLATYALKKPPNLDEALLKIKSIKDSNNLKSTQDMVNESLDFLLYLVDVNELIDVAFGTYDLETTIMVAQKSQRDPKEFLPFYNDLQKLEENFRKYTIDMHLHRYKSALVHISKCNDHFLDLMKLVKEQRLFVDALYLFPSSSEENKTIWREYGSYLEGKGYYDEAGLVFYRADAMELAYKAYRESCNWKECLNIAYHLNYSDQKILGTCQYMAERLKNSGKYLDAEYLLEHFVKDIEEAIVTLIEGCEWSSAFLLMTKYKRNDIAETHLEPALLMLHKTLFQELNSFIGDFESHLSRLKYLRSPEKKKLDEEKDFVSKYMDDDQFSDINSISDVASSHSESTRLSGSIMTRKSSKSRRKQQLKKYRLKEGGPDEDLALIVTLSEIVRKVDSLKDNFLNNLRVLVQHGYDNPAKEIQTKMQFLVAMIDSEMPYIWPSNLSAATSNQTSQWSFGPDATANTITAHRKVEDANVPETHTDPQLAAPPWRKVDIFLNML